MVAGDEHLFRVMLESVGEAVYCVDGAGLCTFINEAAAKMLGYDRTACLGKNMHQLIHHSKADGAHYPDKDCPIVSALKTGKSDNVTNDLVWRSERVALPVDYTVRPFLTGTPDSGATITLRDLTVSNKAAKSLYERARVSALAADIGLALTRSNDLPEMLNMCAGAIVEHLDAAFARIWTLDAKGLVLELQASAGLYTHLDGGHARIPVGKFKIGWIAEAKQPHLTNEVQIDPRVADHEWAKREGMKSFAGYPLIVDGDVIGVAALFARHTLEPETLVSLGSVANSIALGIERKHKEAAVRSSEARNKSVLETSLDCVIMIDAQSRILEWNRAAEQTFGYSREEVLNRKLPETIIPPGLRDAHRAGMIRYLATGEGPVIGKRIEITGMRKNGFHFPVELAINPIRLQGSPHFTATLRDITERKQAQEELQQAKDAAEGANTAKSSFLANMSHELRTPLNAILGYSEMLLEEAKETGAETLSKDLTRINSAGQHLLALIGDILDLSKIDAGRMDLFPESFSVESLVRDVASTVEALAARNNNKLLVTIEPDLGLMFADITKMRQNLFNLLSNAAKFTTDGTIRLTAAANRTSGRDELVFQVIDTGRGIPPERMDLLFQPFNQLEKSISRDFGGTGLGLTITRKFCQMMGGDVSVLSELGQGSTFTIRLPRTFEAPVKAELAEVSPVNQPCEPGGNLVLVIDDDAAARDLMNRNLTRAGLRAALASSGEEGLKLARELKPKVITLDVLMPGMDGWAVLQELKSDPELADIPVVMATMVADRSLGYSLGASDYLMKPVTRERLQTALAKYKCDPPPCSVLLVEDDPDSRDLLRTMLTREGWDVTSAGDGVEALAQMERRIPNVILLDLMMPNMDGFEFTAHLSKREAWRKIPVLVVTAKNLTERERARLNGHVERILTKDPLGIDAMLSEVRSLISSCLSLTAPVSGR